LLEQLKTIYLRTLDACSPERLVRAADTGGVPRNIVAIGKCAGALRDGLDDVDDAIVVVPEGYRLPVKRSEIAIGGHPDITAASFEAGRRLIEFVDAHDEILFLISGGGSACVELPLAPWFDERDLIETNARLVASALPIGDINCVRKHLSAIKGGRLASRVKRNVTLVYSDVSTGALADVASVPTMADPTTKADAIAILERIGRCERIIATLRDDECPETIKHIDDSRFALLADNRTLVAKAAEITASMGFVPVVVEQQIESEVGDAARELLDRASRLREREVLIAGGEPTLVRHGDGKGGRCIELAVRMALAEDERRSDSLVRLPGDSKKEWSDWRVRPTSVRPESDGVDSNSENERRSDSLVRLPGDSKKEWSDWRVRPTSVRPTSNIHALLGTSDGVDGNSGVAAIAITLPAAIDCEVAERELLRSNSLAVAAAIGETIMIPPAGNNLRDLYLLART
jgi:hydroxypyruvate reductase